MNVIYLELQFLIYLLALSISICSLLYSLLLILKLLRNNFFF